MSIRKVVSSLRKNAPSGVSDLARRVALGWGRVTAALRMQPDFIVVGAQRAGTTTLFRVFSEHPEVVRPTVSKGIGYFDLNYAKGVRWYRGHFPLKALAVLRHGKGVQVFESSGYYLFHPLAAERIANDLPDVKVIVMVRDPVERAYSAHRHEMMRGFEREDFPSALKLESVRLEGAEDRIRQHPNLEDFNHRHHAYRARSRYAEQIRRYQDVLGSDRVYIIDADRFFASPEEELNGLFKWLGLREWMPASVAQWNAQPREPMDPQLRTELEEAFADSDAELELLMGRTPSWVERRRKNQGES